MTAAPLAPYLRSPLAADRGRAPDQSPARTFCRPDNTTGDRRLVSSTQHWFWPRVFADDQAVDRNGRPVWLRIWPSPDHWDSPGYFDVPGFRYDGSQTPRPIVVPFNPAWPIGTAPAGMAADNGLLIDEDPAGNTGWELFGLRRPNFLQGLAVGWRSRAMFWPGNDWIADGFGYRTPDPERGYRGRGGWALGGKRRFMTLADEINAGVVEHAVGLVDSLFEHGPGQDRTATGPARFTLPSGRVEHPDRPPCPASPTPAGQVRGRTYPHGTTFAHTRPLDECERLFKAYRIPGAGALSTAALRTAMIIATATSEQHGYGAAAVETGCGPHPMIETDQPLPHLGTAAGTVFTGLFTTTTTVVLNPAP